MSWLFLIAAILIFLLVLFGAQVGSIDTTRLLALGLALFAAAHIPWPSWPGGPGPRA